MQNGNGTQNDHTSASLFNTLISICITNEEMPEMEKKLLQSMRKENMTKLGVSSLIRCVYMFQISYYIAVRKNL